MGQTENLESIVAMEAISGLAEDLADHVYAASSAYAIKNKHKFASEWEHISELSLEIKNRLRRVTNQKA